MGIRRQIDDDETKDANDVVVCSIGESEPPSGAIGAIPTATYKR